MTSTEWAPGNEVGQLSTATSHMSPGADGAAHAPLRAFSQTGTDESRGRVLIIVQNLPVPFDRRVWLESRTLRSAGYEVSVVCPKGPGDPGYAVLEGVEIYKYRPYAPGGSKFSYIAEYVYSFAATLWLTIKASRRGRFAAIQSCNPPDIFWPIGLLFRLVHGSRFVFDHHDLCPETYESRFPGGPSVVLRALRLMEKLTMKSADHVISTNDSYRGLVMDRDGVPAERSTVVRTGPDPERLKARQSVPELRRGRRYLVAYIGVMGPQDGVDIVLRVADFLVHKMQRYDISFTLIGSGDCFDELVALRDELHLQEYVHFTGRAPDAQVAEVLSTADVGISPDPKNPLNDLSTMNKTMEYMAFGLPVVAFDLRETRVSAADAAIYATPNEVDDMARLLSDLLDDPERRRVMGAAGRARIERELAWPHQALHYLDVYDRVVGAAPKRAQQRAAAAS
ncbi:MAG TPA: glycosyltransferase family 4 protein [Acidimicrobiales bacterium]|nr:glycosyltransferase family 4 protein [Acidimicrobiales bacterium]